MAGRSLVDKLLLKPGYRMLVLNAPSGFVEGMGPLPEGTSAATEAGGIFDFVQLFVVTRHELARLAPIAMAAVKEDGLFWITYPKRSSGVATDLTRDEGWEPILKAGYRAVAQVAIDETWSAVRFRPQAGDSPADLVDAQFNGPKAGLRPLYEALVAAALQLDPAVKVAPRQSYVALQRGKTFALLKASTRDRLDVGLKLPTFDETERLRDAAGFGSGSITHRVAVHTMADIDEELLGWLQAAYQTVA